ncbi:MAG: hypothetical protein AUG44_18815 [Actinobacteria bacterium 13_1_20CM_3_71_11]|nr:MAG: hypothetical protein AUG44_18815 [Actinobacteria bacterium 13_1_20CM_3_71_11]
MPYVLGVAAGNGATLAALSRRRRDRWGEVELVRLGTAATSAPSTLRLTGDGAIAGGPGDRPVSGFLRRIGDDVPMVLDGWRFAAPELGAELIGWVVDRVVAEEGEAPEHVVVVVPAYWGPYRCGLLEEALWRAGLDEVSLVPEPVAAAWAYAAVRPVEPGTTLGVYAHGATSGESDRVIERLGRDTGAPDAGELLARCRFAKESLSTAAAVTIPVPTPAGPAEVTLSATEFEELVQPVLDTAVGGLTWTVRAAGVAPGDLGAVLLVGGTTRIPLLRRLLEAAVPAPVVTEIDPVLAVVDGAVYAAQAARSGEPVLAASRDASVPAAREDVVVARPPRPPIVITPLDPPRRRAARHVARDLRASGYPAGA